MDLTWSLHFQYISSSLSKTRHFSIDMSFSIMNKAFPLSVVRTILAVIFLHLQRASFFFADIGDYGFGLGCEFCEDILDFSIVFRTVSFSIEAVFSN